MTINALQSSGYANTPVAGSNLASSQRNSSPNTSDAAAASAAALQSTQVTLSASATLSFSDIPSSLGLNLTSQNNPWNIPSQQSGSSTPSASSLLGEFAENELASQLSSPSALSGATVTMNSFSSQSINTAGYVQDASNGQAGQGTNQSATVTEASNSITLQGSGDITLADGEVIPFTAALTTSASVVESSGTQASGGTTTPTGSAATSGASPLNLSSLNQTLNQPNSQSAQPASTQTGTSAESEWTKMLQQYNLLLNLFETVNAAVGHLQAPQSSAAGASTAGSTGSTQASTASTVATSAAAIAS
jgi:hypothetical protein